MTKIKWNVGKKMVVAKREHEIGSMRKNLHKDFTLFWIQSNNFLYNGAGAFNLYEIPVLISLFEFLFLCHHFFITFLFFIILTSTLLLQFPLYKNKKKREKALIYASVLRKICDTLLEKHYASMNHKRLHKGVYTVSYTHLTLPTIYSV